MTRDADGLVVDAYSDDSLSDGPRVDALDADVLVSDLALEQMDTASPRDEALELPDAVSDDAATTRNEDAHVGPRRSIERGIGAELNSQIRAGMFPDELRDEVGIGRRRRLDGRRAFQTKSYALSIGLGASSVTVSGGKG